jgi:phage shock protein PspC (stress-responsive transcriptional regulator)
MLPGGLFVSRLDFLRRVAVKHVHHDSLNCLPLLAYLVLGTMVPQCGRKNVLPGIEWSRIVASTTEVPMYCDGCGAPVQAGQAFCSRCGKQFVGPVTALHASTGRVQRHVHLLGILWLAFSAFNAIGGVVVYIIANTLFAPGGGTGAPPFLHPLLSVIGIFVLGKAALGFIAGWGLLQREPWARIVALVLGFISLFNIPFGTVIGVYTMWVFLPSQSQQEFEAMVAARAA